MANSSSDNGNTVVVSGMLGNKTFFADAPVVIDINGLDWPVSSPFKIVRVKVVRANSSGEATDDIVGDFHADTGGQTSISFDISSALKTMWSDEEFNTELEKAQNALSAETAQTATRGSRKYFLRIYTEYLTGSIGSDPTVTQCEDSNGNTDILGGYGILGGMTEWERSLIDNPANADISSVQHTGLRNGDASTKPTSTPERVGKNSITSWVDVEKEHTKSIFYPSGILGESDDPANSNENTYYNGHAPIVLRDSVPYIDFLFVNRRGAVETCSALMLEAMDINVETTTYARTEKPTFAPKRSPASISKGGRREWSMSSGGQTRDWAEWWTSEFLMAKRWWMRCNTNGKPSSTGSIFAPVIVEPTKKQTGIYDRTKQQMPSVEFTVRMALEG